MIENITLVSSFQARRKTKNNVSQCYKKHLKILLWPNELQTHFLWDVPEVCPPADINHNGNKLEVTSTIPQPSGSWMLQISSAFQRPSTHKRTGDCPRGEAAPTDNRLTPRRHWNIPEHSTTTRSHAGEERRKERRTGMGVGRGILPALRSN